MRDAVLVSARDHLHVPFAEVKFPYNRTARVLTMFSWNGYWWQQVDSSSWELETYYVLDELVKHNTVYVDFGTWIGPTLLFGAQRARRAFGFEPDPFAFAEVAANVLLNHEFKHKIFLANACVSDVAGARQMKGLGVSGSSLSGIYTSKHSLFQVIDAAPMWSAYCFTLHELLQYYSVVPLAPHEELFIKIDTEGAEAPLIPSLYAVFKDLAPRISVYLSMHDVVTQETYPTEGREKFIMTLHLFTYATEASHFALGAKNFSKDISADKLCRWCSYVLHF